MSAPAVAPGRRAARAPAARAAVCALSVAVGLVLLSAAVNAFVPSQHGPDSSSYATTPGGLAAYAELLVRTGHPVTQLRQAPAAGLLQPRETVILLDPDAVLGSEGRALAAFVAAGGHLVTGGSSANSFLATILPRPPHWTAAAERGAGPLAQLPETVGVGSVLTLGGGGWTPGSGRAGLRAALGRPDAPRLLLVGSVGQGRIALLADASPLQNRLLASADNARLGVDLAGSGHRPVVFVESVHGYGVARGLAALPGRWWWAVAGLILAGLAWVTGRWRRLGPPSPRGRTLPPARSAYLQAMTTLLRRANKPAEAAALARASARRLLVRRAGLGAGAGADQHLEGARRLGLDDAQARMLADEQPPAAEDLLILGTALARLQPGGSPDRGAAAPWRRG